MTALDTLAAEPLRALHTSAYNRCNRGHKAGVGDRLKAHRQLPALRRALTEYQAWRTRRSRPRDRRVEAYPTCLPGPWSETPVRHTGRQARRCLGLTAYAFAVPGNSREGVCGARVELKKQIKHSLTGRALKAAP